MTYALLSLLPVAIPTAYILVLKVVVSRHVTVQSETALSETASALRELSSIELPVSLPDEVTAPSSTSRLSFERVVSRPVPYDVLAYAPNSAALLNTYARTVMEAFSWTPQAFIIRAMIKEPELKASFEASYIRSLTFNPGEIVDGVYRASHKGGSRNAAAGEQRIEFTMFVPESYKGPSVHGLVLCSLEPTGDDSMLFVNETWMWRSDAEKPTMLESAVGRWFHSLLAGWMILRGIATVTGRKSI
jgi:hypothetical protein